jgi:hypothetical protein
MTTTTTTKPLRWKRAHAEYGERYYQAGPFTISSDERVWRLRRSDGEASWYPTLRAAKAAAQRQTEKD